MTERELPICTPGPVSCQPGEKVCAAVETELSAWWRLCEEVLRSVELQQSVHSTSLSF